MRRTRDQWTAIQAKLPMTDEATELWELIEGKKWKQKQAAYFDVPMTPEQAALVKAAEKGQLSGLLEPSAK